MSTGLPANYVLNSYVATENMLAEFLQFVPYCKGHLDIWSPKLVTILLETCSQLDSLWAYQAAQSPYVPKSNLNIRNYFEYFGAHVAPKWVVFWSEEPEQIYPFEEWRDKITHTEETYPDLDWWKAHNKLKHDRLANRSEATLQRAIRALAGLLLAILRCKECSQSAVYLWMDHDEHPYPAYLDDESSPGRSVDVTVETKLFTYAPYWGKQPIPRKAIWNGSNPRFRSWLEHEARK